MSPLVTSLIVFFGSIAVAALGFSLQRPLRLETQDQRTHASARAAIGQLAMLTIIVLGMVTAAVRDTYSSSNSVVSQSAVDAVALDRILEAFGPDASEARQQLKRTILDRIEFMQSDDTYATADRQAVTDGSIAEGIYGAVYALRPDTDMKRDLRDRALQRISALTQSRWFFSVRPSPTPGVFLFVVGLWIFLQSFSLGLFGERNRADYFAICMLAVVFSSAAFLLLEVDEPFDGFLRVSVEPLQAAVQLMGR